MSTLYKTLSALTLTATLAGCGGGGTPLDRSFYADVGDVRVYQDASNIYSPDGREQFLFRYWPQQPRSLQERIALAEASMDQRRDCTWARQSVAEINSMTQIDPNGQAGFVLVAFAEC